MSKAIDELKELEAACQKFSKGHGDFNLYFWKEHAPTYRRLALELADKFRSMSRVFDIQLPIIFSPSDPRVVVGREYEFSNSWDFRAPETAILVEVNKYGDDMDFPFCFMDETGSMPCRVFLRELPKDERGQNE